MFQKSYLFPFLSVAENIGFGLKVKGDFGRNHTRRSSANVGFDWSAWYRKTQT